MSKIFEAIANGQAKEQRAEVKLFANNPISEYWVVEYNNRFYYRSYDRYLPLAKSKIVRFL